MTEFPRIDSGLTVPMFNLGDDPIACLNKAIAFLTAIASSRFPSTNNQLRTSSNPRNQGNATTSGGNSTSGHERVVKCYNVKKLAFLADPGIFDDQAIQTIIPNNAAFQTEDLDAYDSD
ncbi:hypothetical protein Tco_1565909 [Tanacetum coccineum]